MKNSLSKETIESIKGIEQQSCEQVSIVWFEDGTMSMTGNQKRCLQVTQALSAYEKLQGVDLDGLNETLKRRENGWDMSAVDMARLINAAQLVADIGRGK